MLTDDNLGEKLVNIGLPLVQSCLESLCGDRGNHNQYLAVVELDGAMADALQNLPVGNSVLNPALGITNSNTFMKTRPALPLASCSIKVGIASVVMHSGKMDSEP